MCQALRLVVGTANPLVRQLCWLFCSGFRETVRSLDFSGLGEKYVMLSYTSTYVWFFVFQAILHSL